MGRQATFTGSKGYVNADFTSACTSSGAGQGYFGPEKSPYKTTIPAGTGCIILYDDEQTAAVLSVLVP